MKSHHQVRIRSEAWLKRKQTKQSRKKEFLEKFGKPFKCRVRVPDDRALQFFNLSRQLGHKNDGEMITWLMNQAQPAINQLLGTQPKIVPNKNNPSTYQVNQVWALWDEHTDGMPRTYARINKLLLNGLKMEVVFFEPVPEPQWSVHNKLPMACGTFKEAVSTSTVEIHSFSHFVDIREGYSVGKTFYRIFPQKGEVWAVFKDWNVSWTLHDLMTRTRYDMVEVESYICEEDGVVGIFLTRVGTTGAVFERSGHLKHQKFSGKELLKFSHHVSASKLTKENVNGVPSESWELDSAAVPLYLL